MKFEWDRQKARANFSTHRISFEEALTVFADPLGRIHADPDHSSSENREILIGHSARNRLLLVSFVERADATRIISARQVTPQERNDYQEGIL